MCPEFNLSLEFRPAGILKEIVLELTNDHPAKQEPGNEKKLLSSTELGLALSLKAPSEEQVERTKKPFSFPV